ncbi:ABC transporter permease [Paenibacillus eucommiae]|uniref:Aldouronate transport system permease protein n=1 Tax=Paenibacillus eucommiae TaxID=1355755 RepID=A0ABS4IPM3_9BACL|nr:ABC transporter permease subunit [Paenibacillus eucommiae]MBP1988871.1 putative aldouronate transport system permease protein [Paenibacillus eucommiae]
MNKRQGSPLSQSYKKNIQLSILALPAILLIFVFSYVPMAGIFIAFKDINYAKGLFHSPWVGFENFKFFFSSSDAWLVVRNTLSYNIIFIAVGTFLSIVFAILLNEVLSTKLVKVYQTIFFFPYFFSWIIVAYMTYSFIGPYGMITSLLEKMGINFDFYTQSWVWPILLTLINVWKGLGYMSIIFYAGIMGISQEYFEAASIDGASKFQMIRNITVPLLMPLITIMTLLSIGKIFYSDFGLFFFVPREIGQLFPVTQVIDTYVYRMLKVSGDLGMSSAVGLFQSTMGFIVVLLSNFIVKKVNDDNKLF